MKNMLEPGLLRIFRFYTALQILAVLANATVGIQASPNPRLYSAIHAGGLSILLLGLLGLPRFLGRYFLPVMLAFAVIEPLLSRTVLEWIKAWQNLRDYPSERVFFQIGVNAITLFIPLMITAWQYGLRAVFIMSTCVSLMFLGMYQIFEPLRIESNLLFQVVTFQFATYMILGSFIAHLVAEQRRQRQQLTHYAAALEQLTITRERNRLARELHDTLAHTQSGVIVQLEGVDALWESNPTRAHNMFRQALLAMRSGLGETRRALEALRATPLEDMGLKLAIASFAYEMAERGRFQLDLHMPERFDNLQAEVEQVIYRVVQEALTNIFRHACADKVKVVLEQEGSHLAMTIIDNGKGFSSSDTSIAQRFGLRGMREHVESIGGTFSLQSSVGQGTTIQVRVSNG